MGFAGFSGHEQEQEARGLFRISPCLAIDGTCVSLGFSPIITGMTSTDNLFAGLDTWIASRSRLDPLWAFASRFGAGQIDALPAVQPGPEPDEFASLAGQLTTAALDGAVLFSAAGAIRLIEAASGLPDPQRFLAALADCRLLVAGPRAARVLQRRDIAPRLRLAEPDDWRQLLALLVKVPDLAQSRLAIESTTHDLALRTGLEARGVGVRCVPLVAAPLRPIQIGKAAATMPPALVLLADLDGLAGALATECPLAPAALATCRLFAADAELVEAARLLGLDARLITTRRPAAQWSAEEAWQIASQLW